MTVEATPGSSFPRPPERAGEAAAREPRGFAPAAPNAAQGQLEAGEVLVMHGLAFDLGFADLARLQAAGEGRADAVSFDPSTGALRGATGDDATQAWLAAALAAYAGWALSLVWDRLPAYAPHLALGRTRFRPRPAELAASGRKDGRRLHVDAFPAQPTQGRRILRVIHNIDPGGEPHVWQAAPDFTDYAARFLPQARPPRTPAWLLRAAGLTRGRRTAYDALMLALHEAGKADEAYQATAPRKTLTFPPHATWMLFGDAVPHAALSGRFALEQSFFLPIEAMADPDASPLRTLERMTGRPLA